MIVTSKKSRLLSLLLNCLECICFSKSY